MKVGRVNLKADLFQVVPEIDLKELVAYAKSKNIGLILWAGYYAFERDLEKICKHYSELGIKGFKVDFMDRDDQQMVDFHYRGAEIAAKYHLMLDYHGTYKPTGMNRTYPNVINFEGVHGLEQLKFTGSEKVDQVTYDDDNALHTYGSRSCRLYARSHEKWKQTQFPCN